MVGCVNIRADGKNGHATMKTGLKCLRPRSSLLTALFLGLIMLLVFGASAGAGEDVTTVEPAILSAAEIDYPPFCFVDDYRRAGGFSVELLRAALAVMGRDVTFRLGPWAEVRDWLERGEVQVLPLVGRTPEREAIFDFTFPYMSLHGAIVVREGSTDIHDLGDLSGRQVAVLKGDNAEEFLRREDQGIKIHTTATFDEALRELASGRHDAVVIQRLVALRLIQATGLTNLRIVNKPIEGFRQDFCFAVKEGDRQTLALLNEGLALVMADGTFRHLHAKWFAALELPFHRRIVVGGDHNYPPYEYLDEHGRPSGYNVELTRAIAQAVGLDIDIRLGPWSEIVHGLDKGRIDVIQGMFYSLKRDLKFDFTPPHTVNHCVSVVRKGEGAPPATVGELKGKRIVVQQGDIMHDFAVENGLEDQVSAVDAQEDALRELAAGKHDCALVSRMTAMYWIKQYGWDNLTVGNRPFLSPEYCYAVANNQKALLASFSEGLKIIEETGEYRRIYDKWLGVYREKPLSLMSALRYSAMVLVPLLLILLTVFLWSWSLRKQVTSRTKELRKSEEFQRSMIACSPVALYGIDLDGIVLTWNASAERLFGWTADEVIGRPLPIIPEDKQEEFAGIRRQLMEGHGFVGLEVIRRKKDGLLFLGSLSVAPIKGAGGDIIGIMGAMLDISERKRMEAALQESEALFRKLFEEHAAVKLLLDSDTGQIIDANKAAEAFYGWPRDQLKRMKIQDINTLSSEAVKRELEKARARNRTYFEFQHRLSDGSIRDVAVFSSNIEVKGRDVLHSIIQDITERKRAEELLRASEERFSKVFRASPIAMSIASLSDGKLTEVNDVWCKLMGFSKEEAVGYNVEKLKIVDHEQRSKLRKEFLSKGYLRLVESEITTKSGNKKSILTSSELITIKDEPFSINSVIDITEWKRAEEALRYHEVLLREKGRIAKIGGWEFDPATGKGTWTEEVARIHDLSLDDQTNFERGMTFYQGESRVKIEQAVKEAVELGKPYDLELELVTSKGVAKKVRTIGRPMVENGRVVQVRGSFQDITERCRLEEQVQQAQRLESVGRLAGGVAHDFNNMLTVILGYAELMLTDLSPTDPHFEKVRQIMEAGIRSRNLIRQLLAFSRKQVLQPEVLDLNAVVRNLEKMLRRLISEDIELMTHLAENLGAVEADPGQLEQVIMNLAVNARDAMTGGGKLTIDTAEVRLDEEYARNHEDVKPGDYVMVAVTDTGQGMDEQTRSKIFEPFFTTKEQGKGTGLGLATVYGIVKQSGGNIWCYSEPGRGTTFKVYLPRVLAGSESQEEVVVAEASPSGGEHVLVVEDEASLRGLLDRMLSSLKYRVTVAADGSEALDLIEGRGLRPDLVITDVVMPRMSGRELVERLRKIRPDIKVLFMSGYTDNAIVHHGVLDPGTPFLQKPFNLHSLATKVRELLEPSRA